MQLVKLGQIVVEMGQSRHPVEDIRTTQYDTVTIAAGQKIAYTFDLNE